MTAIILIFHCDNSELTILIVSSHFKVISQEFLNMIAFVINNGNVFLVCLLNMRRHIKLPAKILAVKMLWFPLSSRKHTVAAKFNFLSVEIALNR